MEAAIEALGDATRRRIVELLAETDLTAGDIASSFGISRPGVSRHLRVLREAGLVESRAEAQRRVYRLCPEPLDEIDRWIAERRRFWSQRLDALDTEIRRGRRDEEDR
ncbi:MAG: metalloregulator ArsR/SmtB family transcription factor [Actinomycetota bacterium]